MGSPEGAGWEEGRLQVRQGGVIVELGADQGAGCTRAHAHPCLYTGESTEEGAVEGEGQQSSGPEGGDSGRASSTRGEVPGGGLLPGCAPPASALPSPKPRVCFLLKQRLALNRSSDRARWLPGVASQTRGGGTRDPSLGVVGAVQRDREWGPGCVQDPPTPAPAAAPPRMFSVNHRLSHPPGLPRAPAPRPREEGDCTQLAGAQAISW